MTALGQKVLRAETLELLNSDKVLSNKLLETGSTHFCA